MAQQKLVFTGSVDLGAPVGSPSGQPQAIVAFDETSYTQRILSTVLRLTGDSAVTLNLGQLSTVNFLSIRADGGKVRVRITSADGTSQSIPVDPFLILRCDSVGITAIDITRTAGIDTDVYVVLGEKS